MSKVIALFNMSGGVGKSTLTMNLGYHLATDIGKRVLLVDMDPQASLTTFMGLGPFELEKTIYHSLLAKEPLPIIQNLFTRFRSSYYLGKAGGVAGTARWQPAGDGGVQSHGSLI